MTYMIAGEAGVGAVDPMDGVKLAAGYLPELCPTASEVQMALHFPDDSELMHQWLSTNGGRIVLRPLVEGDEHYGDPTWRQGHIVMPNEETGARFEYRATPPGAVSKALFSALGWLAGEKLSPRGFLAGRIVPAE